MAKRKKNPAVSGRQYRLAEAVAHGTARKKTRMSKRAAKELIARTPKKKRSAFMRHNPAKKRNPEDAAAAAYEEFHGKPPEVVIEVDTPIRYHKVVAGMAKLKYFDVQRADGKAVRLSFDKGTYLTENEAKNQLFVTGGDQSVDLRVFGIVEKHEFYVLGKVVGVGYFTEKKHLISKDGGKGVYEHPFGYTRKGGREVKVSRSDPPTLIYDARNKLMTLAGGSYTIKAEGIDG